MNAMELIRAIRVSGGTIAASGDDLNIQMAKGKMTSAFLDALKDSKRELLQVLANEHVLDESMGRLEKMMVAIRIESNVLGAIWLVGSESSRTLVDTSDPVYTAREARFLVDLSAEHVHLLHGFKKQFGGTVDWRDADESEQL